MLLTKHKSTIIIFMSKYTMLKVYNFKKENSYEKIQ